MSDKGRLQLAVIQKREELRSRAVDLNSVFYPGKEDKDWSKRETEMLNQEIEQIQNYINNSGQPLDIARCRHGELICLLAHRGFDSCHWKPGECEFKYAR